MPITKRAAFAGGGLCVVIVAAGMLWYEFAADPSVADAGNPRLVALGKAVYGQYCAACHGANLEGQPDWKDHLPNGRLPAPPHDATGHTWHHPDKQIFDLTKNGAAGVLPGYESDMPAFKAVLSDSEIWAVLAYIKSTWPPDIRARQERISRQSETGRQ